LEGRVDLRNEFTFTIDPETAKDFDDALTLLDDRVFVHIADVSWFVEAGTPLDRGAAGRAFSVYVPGLVSPMLPPDLSDDLCSLRPNVDRLCVTVEVELGSGEPRFYRSVIRSDARLTYAQAEAILAGRERAEPELLEALQGAERVTTELRERRFARGALRIEGGDVAFEFDGEGGVANPPVSGSRVPPGAPAGARRLRRSIAGGSAGARGAGVGARARGGAARVPRRRDLPRVAARAATVRARLGGIVRGRDRRLDPV